MSRLKLIKEKLASLLVEVEMSTIKTDKAVLEYDGELAEGVAVYVIDAETEERIAAADGEYITEDNKVITVAEGKVVSIVEKEVEPIEEPTEEPIEEPTEELEEPIIEEKPTEEPDADEQETEEVDEIAVLKEKVAELEAKIADLVQMIEGLKTETEEKFEKMSAANPIVEEFEKTKSTRKTGVSKVDRFNERYGA